MKQSSCADKAFNQKSNRTRAGVGHNFSVIKQFWGYQKVRYRGLENAVQVFTMADFYLVGRVMAVT